MSRATGAYIASNDAFFDDPTHETERAGPRRGAYEPSILEKAQEYFWKTVSVASTLYVYFRVTYI